MDVNVRRCRVCAVSSGGQGEWSNETSFQTPPTLPCPPNDLHVVGKATQSSTLLSWSELITSTLIALGQWHVFLVRAGRPSSDGGSEVTCYEVQCRRQEGEWVAAGTVAEPHSFSSSAVSSLTYTLTHLTPGTEYTARVGCRNTVGVGWFTLLLPQHVHSYSISLQLSVWSDCVTLHTAPGPPATPHGHSVTMVTAHSVQLQWMVSTNHDNVLQAQVIT